MYLVVAACALGAGAGAQDVFLWTGTIGTLILLIVYLVTTVGAIRLLFFTPPVSLRRWELIVPVLALVVLGYTVFRNVLPYPSGAASSFPIVAGGWILLGVLAVLFVPSLARFGEREELPVPDAGTRPLPGAPTALSPD
jgi:amino acid transporter